MRRHASANLRRDNSPLMKGETPCFVCCRLYGLFNQSSRKEVTFLSLSRTDVGYIIKLAGADAREEGFNPRARPESTRSKRAGDARPALPIGRRDARAFSARGHVARRGRSPSLASYVPDNEGCSQATAWMLRLIGGSTVPRAFPPFFLSSSKGGRRRGAEDVARIVASALRRVEEGKKKTKNKPRRIPSPCRSNRYTHTTSERLRTCAHERSHVHPRMLRAFVTFYYWQLARYNRACSPDRASRRQPTDAPNSDTPSVKIVSNGARPARAVSIANRLRETRKLVLNALNHCRTIRSFSSRSRGTTPRS